MRGSLKEKLRIAHQASNLLWKTWYQVIIFISTTKEGSSISHTSQRPRADSALRGIAPFCNLSSATRQRASSDSSREHTTAFFSHLILSFFRPGLFFSGLSFWRALPPKTKAELMRTNQFQRCSSSHDTLFRAPAVHRVVLSADDLLRVVDQDPGFWLRE